MYLENGEEVFVGTLNGEPAPSRQLQVRVQVGPGRHDRHRGPRTCQHPIVTGTGTGAFEGATGRLDFKDEVTTGEYFYRGHIK